jgi:hypothetical protein
MDARGASTFRSVKRPVKSVKRPVRAVEFPVVNSQRTSCSTGAKCVFLLRLKVKTFWFSATNQMKASVSHNGPER